jgi:hypothetical protein
VPQGVFNTSPGETFQFDVNTNDPDVLAYVRNGLNSGVLAFTRDNVDPAAIAPTMELIVSLPEPGIGVGLAGGAVLLLALRRLRSRPYCP